MTLTTGAGRAWAGEWLAVLDARLCRDAVVTQAAVHEMVSEASAILQQAGVALRFFMIGDGSCDRDDGSWTTEVVVRIGAVPPSGRVLYSKRAVASIPFVAGRPLPTISVSAAAAAYLIARDPTASALMARVSPRVRERWTGCMLGRALAHEIGHYLLRSPAHSTTGLMRGSHTVDAFIRAERTAFLMTDYERRLLAAAHAVASRNETTGDRR